MKDDAPKTKVRPPDTRKPWKPPLCEVCKKNRVQEWEKPSWGPMICGTCQRNSMTAPTLRGAA